MILLAALSLTIGLGAQPCEAAPVHIVITVRVVGLFPNVGTTVYVNGTARGTIHGEGTLSLTLLNYTQTISVDSNTPNGYPYYGYPYYVNPGPSWGPYGFNGVSFACRGNSQTVRGVSTTVTFSYDPLYFLYVKSDRGNPMGSGWYLAGSIAPIAIADLIEESENTRYRFDKWMGGNMRESETNPVNLVYMDSPKMVEATWMPQYKLSVNSVQGQVTEGGWFDRDQTASFSAPATVDGGEGTRYVFTSWTGDYTGSSTTGSVVMSGPKTVTATWKTQYLLTVDPKGGQVDKANQWVDSGSSISVTAVSPCNVVEKKSRLVFFGWDGVDAGTSNTATVVMDGPKALTATWRTQYYLIVETKYGNAAGEGWYDADSTAAFSVPQEVPMNPPLGILGGKYVFTGWSGDSTSNTPKSMIVMEDSHIVTASWSSDYTMMIVFFAVAAAAGVALAMFAARRSVFKGVSKHLPNGVRAQLKKKPESQVDELSEKKDEKV